MRSALKCDGRDRNILVGTPDAVQLRVFWLLTQRGGPGTFSRRIALPELRKDPITGRWVIISTERGKRPNDFLRESVVAKDAKNCPFCAGNEAKTPPEVLGYGRNGGGANTTRWSIRVVPNKFPAFVVDDGVDREGEGLFDKMNGFSAPEVIVESPD